MGIPMKTNDRITDWLAGLKVGDTVVVKSSNVVKARYDVTEVMKVTPTRGLRIKGYMTKLFKNGRVPSHGWGESLYLCMPTNDLIDKIAVDKMRKYLKKVDWEKIPADVVKHVCGVVR